MENSDETLRESFEKEMEKISNETILNPAYKRKKLILWGIRSTILIVFYAIFWKHDWVKYSLLLTIPLSLFSLFTILASPYLINRKIEKTRRAIDNAEKIVNEEVNE